MTQVKLVQFKFKADSKQIWLDWAEELTRRREEVLATLKNEGVVSEACFMANDGESVYYFMEAEDFEKEYAAIDKNPHPIDAEHQEARRSSLEFFGELPCLFHFAT